MPLPSGWLNQDVGATGTPGTTTYSAPTFSLLGYGNGSGPGGGTEYGATADQFQFAYEILTGDVSITARLAPGTGFSTFGGFAVMIRNTLDAGSMFFAFVPSGGSLGTVSTGLFNRTATNAPSANLLDTGLMPYVTYYRVVRVGNTFTAFHSADGTTWTQSGGSFTVTFGSAVGAPVYVGLCAWNEGGNTAKFDAVTTTGLAWLPPIVPPSPPAAASGEALDPQIVLQLSDDGGRTWGIERPVSLGKKGDYKRIVQWRRLGLSRNRAFRVICSAPVHVALSSADLTAR